MGTRDLFSFHLRKYEDSPTYGYRKLGKGRFALDFGTIALVFEFWFWR